MFSHREHRAHREKHIALSVGSVFSVAGLDFGWKQ
jgi:hypothetical protein